jgi:2'-5' RNA ligase
LPPLAKIVEDALVPLHFEPERRVFVPHVTVGRWRQFGRAQETLSDVLREWQEREFGGFSVNEVVLFQSLLSAKGAEYRRLKIMHLSNTAALA